MATHGVTPERRKHNLRLALILASVAVAFFVGIVVKFALFGG
ncbi:MAG: cytochrome oxidase small assembly protein [Betaproteobacteria bacterium]